MTYRFVRLILSLAPLPLLTACENPAAWREVLPVNRYYTASTAMEPTLPNQSRVNAHKITVSELARGDVVIVRTTRGENYVKRMVGLPGDAVALKDGIVVLNGEKVEQRPSGEYTIVDELVGPEVFARYAERFPGEAKPHFILDRGAYPGDNFAEIKLAEDEYFLLGDNRDASADSRYNEASRGIGIVSGEQIHRRVDLESLSD